MSQADRIFWQEHETPLLRRFFALQHNERVTIEREDDSVPERARFYRLEAKGGTAMGWRNRPPPERHPYRTKPASKNPNRSLYGIDPPSFEYDESYPPRHFHRSGQKLIVTDAFLECMRSLDPDGFEHRPADVRYARKFENLPSFHLILPLRVLDPVDLPRTRVELSYNPLPRSDIFMRHANINEGYTVSKDVPADVHLFLSAFNADILASIELIDCLRKNKVRGLYAYRTEGGMFGGGPRAPKGSMISL